MRSQFNTAMWRRDTASPYDDYIREIRLGSITSARAASSEWVVCRFINIPLAVQERLQRSKGTATISANRFGEIPRTQARSSTFLADGSESTIAGPASTFFDLRHRVTPASVIVAESRYFSLFLACCSNDWKFDTNSPAYNRLVPLSRMLFTGISYLSLLNISTEFKSLVKLTQCVI